MDNSYNSEIDFWDNYIKTKGHIWPEGFKSRINPETPIIQSISNLISFFKENNIKILDVGSGPITNIGFKNIDKSKNTEITATDVLADKYNELLEKYNIIPPVKTTQCDSIELSKKFKLNDFNIVHASNCMDHMNNPLLALLNMISMLKHDGYIILIHNINEGKAMGYNGLHHWDMFLDNKENIIMRRYDGIEYNFTEILEIFCYKITVYIVDRSLKVTYRRK